MTETLLYNNLYLYLFVALFLLCAGILGIVYRRTLIGTRSSAFLELVGIVNLTKLPRKHFGQLVSCPFAHLDSYFDDRGDFLLG